MEPDPIACYSLWQEKARRWRTIAVAAVGFVCLLLGLAILQFWGTWLAAARLAETELALEEAEELTPYLLALAKIQAEELRKNQLRIEAMRAENYRLEIRMFELQIEQLLSDRKERYRLSGIYEALQKADRVGQGQDAVPQMPKADCGARSLP